LTSVKKALATIGAEVFVPAEATDLAKARGIIVPGVGHFGATRALDQSWVKAILARVAEGVPLLGICLGMQWLYESSDEAPELKGLGLLAGRVVRLHPDRARLKADTTSRHQDTDAQSVRSVRLQPGLKVPHVGWNSVS